MQETAGEEILQLKMHSMTMKHKLRGLLDIIYNKDERTQKPPAEIQAVRNRPFTDGRTPNSGILKISSRLTTSQAESPVLLQIKQEAKRLAKAREVIKTEIKKITVNQENLGTVS